MINANTNVEEGSLKLDQPQKRPRSFFDSLKRVTMIIVVAFALLAFPSVVPWMVAFWLVCHTILARLNRPAWGPLAICLSVLILKLVPRTPTMLGFGVLLAVVMLLRLKRHRLPEIARQWWLGPVVLWIGWTFLFFHWRSLESTEHVRSLDLSRPVVCIGDSLTEGMLPDHGFPEQLKSMISLPVVNLGFSGIATPQALDQMDRVLSHQPQVVVIELGGHDFLKGHGRSTAKKNLVKMINDSRASGADVILMEIPRGFMFDPYASLEREIAYEMDVQLVPDTWLRQIVLLSPVAPPGKWLPEMQLSSDGIHSNPRGSVAIARRVAAALHQMYGDDVVAK